MKIQQLFPVLTVALIAFTGCNKTEGPGGTSTIRGTVMGREFEPAKNEITEVIMSPGSELEHGDFWILNAPVGETYYYIWYGNPTWISDGNPYLEGRTGIEVTFNYSDSNLDIANNTAAAISAIAGNDFTVAIQNDILTLTNKTAGHVPDANNMSTAFEINVTDQGEDEFFGTSMPLADARVYLVYGDAGGYGDEVRTGGDGDYSFTNLVKGNYTVYVVSQDTLSPTETVKSAISVTIDENKSVQQAADLQLIY